MKIPAPGADRVRSWEPQRPLSSRNRQGREALLAPSLLKWTRSHM